MGDVHGLVATLIESYPHAFDPRRRPPLKVGVFTDILAVTDCDPYLLGVALRQWCGHPGYQRSLIRSPCRLDLDGNPAGAVTDAERTHAREQAARN
jgi:ProP effector